MIRVKELPSTIPPTEGAIPGLLQLRHSPEAPVTQGQIARMAACLKKVLEAVKCTQPYATPNASHTLDLS